MDQLIAYIVTGLVTGSVYAIGASGLVVTYATSGIFNIAHGAIGMLMAFTFWELRDHQGWPTWLALIVVLFVIAPALGALIERTLIRRLRGQSVGASLVVTVGLMVSLIGVGFTIWSPRQGRRLTGFFDPTTISFGPIRLTVHDAITFLMAVVVAGVLYVFLSRTRIGIAMRAVVDDRTLVQLNGARPDLISMLSWAIGSSLAALAGILLAPVLQLNHIVLTLLVINAYAAAMAGRLKKLPQTFAAAMVLGLIEALMIGYVNLSGWLLGLRPSLPTLFMFAILLLLPQDRLRSGRITGARTPHVPSLRRSIEGGAALVAVTMLLTFVLGDADVSQVSAAFAFGIVMLSLVLLTGYGGQVSLCQMSFAGVGAFAMAHVGSVSPLLGILVAMLLAGVTGAIVAIPALRLQGLYLALATMAFAVFMYEMVFKQSGVFGEFGAIAVKRPALFTSEASFAVLLSMVFAVVGILILAIRRGPFGRLLAAMRDSQVACATLGLSLARTKLMVFSLSAAFAGLGGALFGALQKNAGPDDYQMLFSLPVLLLAVVGGINTVGGALLGAVLFSILPVIGTKIPAFEGFQLLSAGLAALSIGRNPNGLAPIVARLMPAAWREGKQPPPPSPIEIPDEVSLVAPAR